MYSQNAVKVLHSDNRETILKLSEHPKVTQIDSSLLISTDKEEISVEIGDIDRLIFIDYIESGIDNITTEGIVIEISSELLSVKNLPTSKRVGIFDLSGRQVAGGLADSSGTTEISIQDLGSGVYIINSEGKQIKFYKR